MGLHSFEERATQDAVQRPMGAAEADATESEELDEPTLIVEERLLICLETLHCLRRLARLAQQTNNIPQFSSLARFARATNQFASAIAGHLNAIKQALPVTATNLQAPDGKGSV